MDVQSLIDVQSSHRRPIEIKKLENELKYLEELSNTSTYKEDTSLKQKLEIRIKRIDKLYTEKTKGRHMSQVTDKSNDIKLYRQLSNVKCIGINKDKG
jgi:deoxyadenosine/deoxycytidine kinase